jgi:hypothetical protein
MHEYREAQGCARTVQRFGSALNLNVHFHMQFLDGVYVECSDGSARFRWVKAPSGAELTVLAHTMAQCGGRFLESPGILEQDAEHSYLALDTVEEDSMHFLLGHSITCRIVVGPQAGRKALAQPT